LLVTGGDDIHVELAILRCSPLRFICLDPHRERVLGRCDALDADPLRTGICDPEQEQRTDTRRESTARRERWSDRWPGAPGHARKANSVLVDQHRHVVRGHVCRDQVERTVSIQVFDRYGLGAVTHPEGLGGT
jgi:hypothetical protein